MVQYGRMSRLKKIPANFKISFGHKIPDLQSTAKKKTKYNAKQTTVDGITFHSKKEARRYGELKLLEKLGEIKNLELQKRYKLMVNDKHICSYDADFVYEENGRLVVEDVKGKPTPEYKLKAKLMEAIYGITIYET